MRPLTLAKWAACGHVGLVAGSVYIVVRVYNFTPIERLPTTDVFAFSATAIPPLVSILIGSRLARSERQGWILAAAHSAALAAFGLSLIGVHASEEPLAPLWLLLVSLWMAVGFVIVLALVWWIGRGRALA